MFFDKLCTISSITYTNVGGFDRRTSTALYTSIECNFEQNKKKLYSKEYGENTSLPDYIVVLPIQYANVRENMDITLIDPVLGNLGEFIISSIDAQKSIGGNIDCITLYVQSNKGQ